MTGDAATGIRIEIRRVAGHTSSGNTVHQQVAAGRIQLAVMFVSGISVSCKMGKLAITR